MPQKKILIVTTTSLTIATILKFQPKYLSDEFLVSIAASKDSSFEDIEKNEEVIPHLIPMHRGINPFYDLYSIFLMTRLILKTKPDIVHSYTPKAGLVAMLSSYFCSVPIRIHTFTGLIFPSKNGLIKKILKFIDKLICFFATKIVPEGYGVKAELIKNNITKKDLHVIGNGNIAGIDTYFFSRNNIEVQEKAKTLKEKLTLTDDAFVFIFIGRLNRDKGIDELLSAFETIKSHNVHLLIVGSVDSHAPVSNATINKIKYSDRIKWIGFQNDVRPSLAISNALILPSYREGFPNVLMQAGAMNLPAISTDVCGADEILSEGETGFIVPVKDVSALSMRMNSLLTMPAAELDAMGNKARKRVGDLFEKAEYLQKLKRFYINELSNKKII